MVEMLENTEVRALRLAPKDPRNVSAYAGHVGAAAQGVVDGWRDGAFVDLDTECRRLTLRALGRSVLGLDLDERTDEVGWALRASLAGVADRAARPVNLPRLLPTTGQCAAQRANDTLHRLAAEIVRAVRTDPDWEAPLVRALIQAIDENTGRPLTDDEICHELVLFMLAGHDTTSTTLTYALWSLGHDRHLQERVRAEVAALGNRELTPDDVAELGLIVRVLHEALRLCPPGSGTMRSPTRDIIGDHFVILDATLALATIIRAVDIESLDLEFPAETPCTVVAAGPVRARVLGVAVSKAALRAAVRSALAEMF